MSDITTTPVKVKKSKPWASANAQKARTARLERIAMRKADLAAPQPKVEPKVGSQQISDYTEDGSSESEEDEPVIVFQPKTTHKGYRYSQ